MEELKKRVHAEIEDMGTGIEDIIFEKEYMTVFYMKYVAIGKEDHIAVIYEGIKHSGTGKIEVRSIFITSDMIKALNNV